MMFSAPPRRSRRALRSRIRESGRGRWSQAWLFFVGGLLVISVWAVWFSGFFVVAELDIRGADESVRVAVRRQLERSVFGENLFFIDADELTGELLDRFPALLYAEVVKAWPGGIRVDVVEREAIGVWCRPRSPEQECFLFDDTEVWGHGVPSTGTITLTVMDHHPEGAPYAELIGRIRMVVERLHEIDIDTTQVVLPLGSLNEIHFITTNGYPIYFATESDLGEQLDVLEIFLGEQRAKGEFIPEYIDVRVPGKAYFK